MDLSDLLEPERIRCHCNIQSKKRTLQTLAELLGASLRSQAPDTGNAEADDSGNPPSAESAGNKIAARGMKKTNSRKERARSGDDGTDPEKDALSDMDILDALIGRERLGSTGLGHGVALPHSRMSMIEAPLAAMVTLEQGVDYESSDGQPVDLVLGLLVPEDCNDEHLQILALLARRFSDERLRTELRAFGDGQELFAHVRALPPIG